MKHIILGIALLASASPVIAANYTKANFSGQLGSSPNIKDPFKTTFLGGQEFSGSFVFQNDLVPAGLGFTNPSFLLAVQEASGQANRGSATAAYNFMRMLGGTFGTAILGATFNLSLALRLPDAQNPVQTLMDTDRHGALAPGALAALAHGVGGALHDVFWVSAALACTGVVVARMMPKGFKPGTPAAGETHMPVEVSALE